MKMYVDEVMIRHWIGSDHDNKEAMLGLLVELLNGGYSVEEFRNDVLNLWEETV
jgi:hypothetical protein